MAISPGPKTVPDPTGFWHDEHRVGQASPLSRNQEHDVINSLKTIISGPTAGNLRSACSLGKQDHDEAKTVRLWSAWLGELPSVSGSKTHSFTGSGQVTGQLETEGGGGIGKQESHARARTEVIKSHHLSP